MQTSPAAVAGVLKKQGREAFVAGRLLGSSQVAAYSDDDCPPLDGVPTAEASGDDARADKRKRGVLPFALTHKAFRGQWP